MLNQILYKGHDSLSVNVSKENKKNPILTVLILMMENSWKHAARSIQSFFLLQTPLITA